MIRNEREKWNAHTHVHDPASHDCNRLRMQCERSFAQVDFMNRQRKETKHVSTCYDNRQKRRGEKIHTRRDITHHSRLCANLTRCMWCVIVTSNQRIIVTSKEWRKKRLATNRGSFYKFICVFPSLRHRWQISRLENYVYIKCNISFDSNLQLVEQIWIEFW